MLFANAIATTANAPFPYAIAVAVAAANRCPFLVTITAASLFPPPTANVPSTAAAALFSIAGATASVSGAIAITVFTKPATTDTTLANRWLARADNGGSGHHGQIRGARGLFLDNISLF
jgi:hypothetical protein